MCWPVFSALLVRFRPGSGGLSGLGVTRLSKTIYEGLLVSKGVIDVRWQWVPAVWIALFAAPVSQAGAVSNVLSLRLLPVDASGSFENGLGLERGVDTPRPRCVAQNGGSGRVGPWARVKPFTPPTISICPWMGQATPAGEKSTVAWMNAPRKPGKNERETRIGKMGRTGVVGLSVKLGKLWTPDGVLLVVVRVCRRAVAVRGSRAVSGRRGGWRVAS